MKGSKANKSELRKVSSAPQTLKPQSPVKTRRAKQWVDLLKAEPMGK